MNKTTLAALSAAGGMIVGGAITYIAVNKKLVKRYEDWANGEIDSVKARYAMLNSDKKMSFLEAAENPSPEIQDAVAAGKALMERLGYSEPDADEETPHESARTLSIFEREDAAETEDSDDEETFSDALADDYERVEGEPYLITEEAYFENEDDYELDTLTYYELDDTLTDDHNERIDRVQETVGVRHLNMFKKNGTAKSSIYVRNDEHSSLYEVILVEESYAVKFLGMSEEELGLKEPKRKPKKMRPGDGE